nr:uncharacterized protein LOC127321439 [Lolium perenne]
MESLTPEGRVIYDTLTAASAVQQEQRKKDIDDLITKAVNTAVESAVRSSIDKAVSNMQLYVDGVENTLQQHISELREQVGLAAHQDDPDQVARTLGGDAETGPEGRRVTSATRRSVVGAAGPYIPPPARGMSVLIHHRVDAFLAWISLNLMGKIHSCGRFVEEVGDGTNTLNSSVITTARRAPTTAPVYGRPLDDRLQTRSTEMSRTTDDKIAALRNYRRAKNLCFTCGEKYSREHKCQSTVQLHVVQEMVEFFQQPETYQWEGVDSVTDMELMQLADVSFTEEPPEQSIVLHCTVQGHPAVFLLDSGSNNSFVNASLAAKLCGHVSLPIPRRVKVAGGGILTCNTYIPQCEWTCDKLSFTSSFKILPLKSYDGIVGMDWLSSHSPQLIDWQQKWIAFQHKGAWVCLQGNPAEPFACTVIELYVVQAADSVKTPMPPEVQSILDTFASIFAEPDGLPPHRAVSHSIPVIEGARPVQIRPYRLAPELKNEVEKQIAEMLQSSVIRPSASNFASPLIMVKKKDQTWRPCIDFRHLNALTVKRKYPMHVIDELLDELHGACWFSKLDLRAGYHQIRLTEGDEHKTAFHTHHGHYEFTVMAFGLTGAPATFQAEMNRTLASVLRKYAVVFFDDILVYNTNYQEHLQHLSSVLQLLQDNQWRVKISKCLFAQPSIHYLGHVISASGVATDEEKIATVKEWPTPMDVKQLRSFLGLAGYYRKFVQGYGSISQPLIALLRKNTPFVWTTDTELAFQSLKKALIAAPVLALPDFSVVFVVETDACDTGIGAVLMQKDHPLAFHKVLSKLMGMQYRIVYKKGLENKVADALSRRPHPELDVHAISCSQPAWIVAVLDAYQQDAQAKALLQRLSIAKEVDDQFSLHGGIIRKQGRIWLPSDSAVQEQLIREFHASPMGGHSGIPVTLRRLKQLFVWKGMATSVHQFVKSCYVCQQAKADRSKYSGLLQPLPVPNSAFQVVSMDFIEGLPRSGRFNCIMVVVDKFSRFAHFIPLAHPFSAATVASAFMDNITSCIVLQSKSFLTETEFLPVPFGSSCLL